MESRLALDHQLLLLQRNAEDADSLIENLIRSHAITPLMATSLMTDKGYCTTACHCLLQAARYLFIDEQQPQAQADDSLQLESDELSAINKTLQADSQAGSKDQQGEKRP